MSANARNASEARLTAFFTQLSEELSNAKPSTDGAQYALTRQLSRMRKRAGYVKKSLRDTAISSFLATNAVVGNSVVTLDSRLVANARHFITVVLERFATRCCPDNIQVTLDWAHLLDQWRFGPGTSNGVKGTHAADKVGQPMTCTTSCEQLVKILRRNNTYFRLFDESSGNVGHTVIRGSRLTTVPKNEDTERTIAVEPLGNMALQLAAGRYLEDVLRSIGLDITRQQPKNKLMALRGSIDGSLCTIDLSKASDMISIDLVKMVMPDSWYALLMTLRSPEIDVPGHGWEKLNMISTMGNGFTFPLMTFIITSLIYAMRCERVKKPFYIDWSDTAVFGDDIILPVSEYDEFTTILGQAGLVVNHDKSFSTGMFRESCGGDYFQGYDVTPFYVKHLRDDRDVYVALNQLFEWSGRHSILLVNSIFLLKSFLNAPCRFVPEWHGSNEGFRTTQVGRRYSYLKTIIPRVRLVNEFYLVMLACGGYVSSDSSGIVYYQPRPFKTKVVTKAARLPRGYLNGRCPLSRSDQVSLYIESYSFLLN